MKKKVRKLALNRETLRSLEDGGLRGVLGAASLAPGCQSRRCGSQDTCTAWTDCMSVDTCYNCPP
ncbi:MAG: hypothetical protein QOH06_4427 [Acidobacteriota bacterium]|jgi:hypothetical protein|nr:hypothetical protein [Acidobacteriota bacterium]